MARIVVCYDPEDRMTIPDKGDVPPEMRFALLDIADDANARDLRAAIEHLTELLMEQIET